MSNLSISVVLPIFNEAENIYELHKRLNKVLRNDLNLRYELIFIDDGSSDNSWNLIESLANKDKNIKGIHFSRNFGHHIALTAGLKISSGDAVITMDSDLQDQPEEIPKLIKKYEEGYDVVSAIRQKRRFRYFKNISSKLFTWVINILAATSIPINTSNFRIMSHQVVESFKSFKERERFFNGLISYLGYSQVGVPVEHGTRYKGETKYSIRKMIGLAITSITSFSYRPLRLASLIGMTFSFVGFGLIIFLFYRRFILDLGVEGWTSIVVLIIFLSGIQLVILGLLGEYIGKMYSEVKGRPMYIVDKKIGYE